jgi:hypothetical protein
MYRLPENPASQRTAGLDKSNRQPSGPQKGTQSRKPAKGAVDITTALIQLRGQ